MRSFKAICTVDKGEGIQEHTLFVKDQENEEEAEQTVKYDVLLNKKWTLYNIKISKV